MDLDIRTLTLMNLLGDLISLITLGIIWRQYRSRYHGLGFWFANIGLQTAALALIIVRGSIPDVLSIVVSNFAVQTGVWLLLLGFERFWGLSGRNWPNVLVLAGFLAAFVWWGLVQPDLNSREILLSAVMAWFLVQVAWLLAVRLPGYARPPSRMAAWVSLGLVTINLFRVVVQSLFSSHPSDFFHAGAVQAAAMTVYMTLNLLLTISLVLMVTRRLLGEALSQEEKFAKAFHSAPYAVLITRASDGKIFELNSGFETITGFQRAEVLGKTTPELQIWTSEERRAAFVRQIAAQGKVSNVEMPFRRKSGEPLVGLVSAERITIGSEECLISSIGDVTEQTRLRGQLEELATHDALTGLPNRRLFNDRFQVALSNASRNRQQLAVMSLDLDRFKQTNDQWGHDAGDAVLVEAAARLTGCLRKVDTVARFGGDEFVLLLWEVEGKDDAEQIARKILKRFQEPFEYGGRTLAFQASLGIALYPGDGTDTNSLLKNSDQALYTAKENGRDGYRFSPAVKP